MDYEKFATAAFIGSIESDVLGRHHIGRRTPPLCKDCHVPLRFITGELWQCPKCKKVEAL